MNELINIAVKSIFMENMLLALFLGMCSFLACSKNVKTAVGLGWAVTFVMTITIPINWLINHYLLRPGALSWVGLPEIDLSFLVFITFIATIAGDGSIGGDYDGKICAGPVFLSGNIFATYCGELLHFRGQFIHGATRVYVYAIRCIRG